MIFAPDSATWPLLAKQTGGGRVTRIQSNVVARRERQLLDWLCARLPHFITPDIMTAVSLAAACLALAGYAASRHNPVFLWVASLGFVLNWLGDSLDGSLARHRRIERPAYGYFLDHTVDALNNLVMMVGIGLTTLVRMDAALFALVGYYLLCMYVFINNHLSGTFRLSFLGFGPTELRICLIAINTAMFYSGANTWRFADGAITIYDAILFGAGATFVVLFASHVVAGIRELRGSAARDPVARADLSHSAARKASSAVK